MKKNREKILKHKSLPSQRPGALLAMMIVFVVWVDKQYSCSSRSSVNTDDTGVQYNVRYDIIKDKWRQLVLHNTQTSLHTGGIDRCRYSACPIAGILHAKFPRHACCSGRPRVRRALSRAYACARCVCECLY